MTEQLSEDKLNQILPLLPKIAKQLGAGSIADREFLEEILPGAAYDSEGWAFQELKCWSEILMPVAANPNNEEIIIKATKELQGRGIPEFPVVLAINITTRLIYRGEAAGDELIILKPSESYQDWLPDHEWHNDLDWEHLPSFIKVNGGLINKLRNGEVVDSQNVSYRLVDRRLMRKLHDDRLAIALRGPLEQYNEWLPDHDWHADLDWFHTPLFLQKEEVLNALFQGKQINGRYVNYRISDNRLIRKLQDSVPIFMPKKPSEKYSEWLLDHEWHNDLDWEHLPLWIKRDRKILDDLLIHGKQVSGKYVMYKLVSNRFVRKLHDSVPVMLHVEKPKESYYKWLPDHTWHNDLDWEHLPLWIKGNPKLIDDLRGGKQINGKKIEYKMVRNYLLRRLKRGIKPLA